MKQGKQSLGMGFTAGLCYCVRFVCTRTLPEAIISLANIKGGDTWKTLKSNTNINISRHSAFKQHLKQGLEYTNYSSNQ